MYEYDFVRIELHGATKKEPQGDYRNVVRERAKEGWRLVQVFAPGVMTQYGAPDHLELIFERQVS